MRVVLFYFIGVTLTYILLRLWNDLTSKKKRSKKTGKGSVIGKVFLAMIWPLTLVPLIIMYFLEGVMGLFNTLDE
jgi:uncharacterized membrane protein